VKPLASACVWLIEMLVRNPIIALVGNPNTGKTTLFNALAGMRQRVGNYPGVTVEKKTGRMRHGEMTFDIVDLPGTYSLAPRSPDEMVAVDVILGQQDGQARPDVVVTIVDASNLERNLYLMTQVLELGVPVVVALNMTDVAQAQGLVLDVPRLSRQLGVTVVAMQAHKGQGLDQLKKAVAAAIQLPPPRHTLVFPEAFQIEVAKLRERLDEHVPEYLAWRLLLDVGGYTEKRLANPAVMAQVTEARRQLATAGGSIPEVEARLRYGWIRNAVAGCIQRPTVRPVTWTDRLDRILTHKLWGSLAFLVLMFVVFQAIFTWARPLMDLISTGQGWLADVTQAAMPAGPLRSLLVDGVIKGVGSVLVFLPQIVILFGFIAILEDCGYMARAAFLVDKVMARCGLNGKSFIPLLSSVACAVPGIMAARVIENRRDRFATIMVAPLMSCSARLPVYLLLIGAFFSVDQGYSWWVPGIVMFAMYAVGLVTAPLVALCLKRSLLRGETPAFAMEMPLYKLPQWRTVVQRMTGSAWMFVRRAGTMILATMIVVWALLYFPQAHPDGGTYEERIDRLERTGGDDAQLNQLRREWSEQSLLGQLGKTIEPAVEPLGWDWRVGMAAIASFPAREVMVGTLGLIYNQGKGDAGDTAYRQTLGEALRQAKRPDGQDAFTAPVALSVMVFFALCCQCVSTLAVIRRETNSWRWPAFTFVYMTSLAYLGALGVYQASRWLS
jgi:ferrous iron transport protein B